MRRITTMTLVCLAGLTAPAAAQTKLEWKFKKGDKFYLEAVTDQKQSLQVMGKAVQQNQSSTTIQSVEVKEASGEKVVLSLRFESIKQKKADGGVGGGGTEAMLDKLKGTTFTVTMAPGGKIGKFEGYDEMVNKLAEKNEDTAKMIRIVMSEESLRKNVEEIFNFLPDRPVSKGDTWKTETTLPLGPIGTFKAISNYTLDGKAKEGELISFKSDLVYSLPKAGAEGPFKVTKGDLKAENAKGTLVFDNTRGRLVRGDNSATIKGAITMDIMGNTIDMEMTIDMVNRVRVLDQLPTSKE